jgi:hypothetical protein
MNKVGIITICDYINYGNRLQNFATQEVLRSLEFQVETIVNAPPIKIENRQKENYHTIKNLFTEDFFKKIVAKLKYEINKKSYEKCYRKKRETFRRFTDEHIIEAPFLITEDNIPSNFGEYYDFFVVGSDQVWNPIFRKGSPVDFLTFAPQHKRIAFAPSFGISSIPDKFIEDYRKWLSQMNSLSVREQAGARIISKLTGKDAVVLVDPTLMLTKEKWLSVSKPAAIKARKDYLLTYFLGSVSKENEKKINEIAKRKNLELINLASMKDKARYSADPGEFIDYINSSSVFFTDSFHGAVFSILLEKPFVILEREGNIPSMNSRIDTLLSTFNLMSRKWHQIKNIDEVYSIDYSHIPPILEYERNKSINYLKKALKNENRCKKASNN